MALQPRQHLQQAHVGAGGHVVQQAVDLLLALVARHRRLGVGQQLPVQEGTCDNVVSICASAEVYICADVSLSLSWQTTDQCTAHL